MLNVQQRSNFFYCLYRGFRFNPINFFFAVVSDGSPLMSAGSGMVDFVVSETANLSLQPGVSLAF